MEHRRGAHGNGPSVTLVSAQGKKSTYISALLRIVSAAATGVTLVIAARIFAAYVHADTPTSAQVIVAVCCAILAGLAAAADLANGGVGARAEESRLRRRVLAAYYEGSGVRRDSRSGTQPGDVVTLMTDNSERYTEFRIAYLGTTVAAIIVPILALGYITIAISPLIGLALLAAYPLVPILVDAFMKLFKARSSESRKERGILAGQYLDAIRNLSTIRLLGAGQRIEAHLRDQGERNRGAIMRLLAGNQLVIIVLDGAVGLLWICLAVVLAFMRLHAGAIDLSEALAVVFLTVLLIEPIAQVAGFFYVGMGGLASGRAIKKFLASAEGGSRMGAAGANVSGDAGATASGVGSVLGDAGATASGVGSVLGDAGATASGVGSVLGDASAAGVGSDGALQPKGVQSELGIHNVSSVQHHQHDSAKPASQGELNRLMSDDRNHVAAVTVTDITFAYDGEAPVLNGLSLSVPFGERVGIVGRSGAGKSTFLSLLSGDLRVPAASGHIEISGVDVAAVSARDVHALTAVVAQRTWLFSGTIASNLRMAKPDASEAELWEALEKAHLADEVHRMPEGLGTDVGERGQFLSGGQAQRMSIARAFLSGRKVWLLDEPTAQVDAASEGQIIDALAELPRSITLVVSTHRPSLLALVDRVYELVDGELVTIDASAALARVEVER